MSRNGALFNTPSPTKEIPKTDMESRYREMESKSDNEIMGKGDFPTIDMETLKNSKFKGQAGMFEYETPDNIIEPKTTEKATNNNEIPKVDFKAKNITPNPGMNAETFYLPSRNLLYGENFDGHFNLRMFTTKEERLRLSSRDTFLQTMCSILNSCITTDNDVVIDTKWFTEFDFVYTMYMARIVSYGSMYNIDDMCPNCYEHSKQTINLDDLTINYLEDEFIEPIVIEQLPMSKDRLELRFLRVKDRIEMEKEAMEIRIKNPDYIGDPNYNLKLEYSIMKVNNDELSKGQKREYVDNLPAMDAQYIDYILNKTKAGIDTTIDVICPKCGRKHQTTLSMNSTFFRPKFDS